MNERAAVLRRRCEELAMISEVRVARGEALVQ